MRQDPQGVRKKGGAISVGKEKLKFSNEMTSLDDKLRIANKVNNKYLELRVEKNKILEELCIDVGKESETIIANCSVIGKEGEFHIFSHFFNIRNQFMYPLD